MKDKFLNILKIPVPGTSHNVSGDCYNLPQLIELLSSLLILKISPIHIKGKIVMLKPNWVKHSTKAEDDLCLRTNDNFVLAVLNIVLRFSPAEVIIGDSPIQGCKWDKMISKSFNAEVNKLSHQYNITVEIKDFRRRIYDFSSNTLDKESKPLSDYLIFDLGRESLLEPITTVGKTRFRVTNYDPVRMSLAHAPGIHKYCITRDFFRSDIVISIPKIKTHQKTGITGALKNLVGINGDKDFLPHHRLGGVKFGGDCYPGGSYMRYWSELFLDKANGRGGRRSFWYWQKLSSLLWKLSFPGPEHNIDAGWHGNDTTWRMVMDLNRIAEYGKADGTISDESQRQIFSICDGLIAGQGNGPLNPMPLPLGIISFTNSSYVNDLAMSILMDIPVEEIPLLTHPSLPKVKDCEITINGEKIQSESLKLYSIKAIPPKGWVRKLNQRK